jgi:hypothetical protein
VFDRENAVQIIVVLDDHAGTKLRGRDRHRLRILLSIAVLQSRGRACPERAQRAKDGQATSFPPPETSDDG